VGALAHLAHGMASESGFDRKFTGLSVNAERDAGGDPFAKAVDLAALPWDQQ
jgi:hypothetical protein